MKPICFLFVNPICFEKSGSVVSTCRFNFYLYDGHVFFLVRDCEKKMTDIF